MPATRIQAYTEDMVPHVQAFNARLRRGGSPFEFPERLVWSRPRAGQASRHEEYFLAVENDHVRGGYILKHQQFSFAGTPLHAAYYRLPLSEGTVDKRYGIVGLQLFHDASSRTPLLMGAGMGGLDTPVAKLLARLRWGLHPVPFFFRILRPARFFRGVSHLRHTRLRRLALDLVSASGLGWLGAHMLQARFGRRRLGASRCDEVEQFGDWADDVWHQARDRYLLVADRDRVALNAQYKDSRFLKLRISIDDRVIGWAVTLDTQMTGNPYFGNLRVGSIADAFAIPEAAPSVVSAATRFLESRGVDLIVSNQCHTAWRQALRSGGYVNGPTNFIFGGSPRVLELLRPFDVNKHLVHLNRGDCDGPDLL